MATAKLKPNILPATIQILPDGNFNCICGNSPDSHGAYPCNFEGDNVEPTPDEWPDQLYRCDRCGIVFVGDSGVIRGQRMPFRKPDETLVDWIVRAMGE